MSNKFWFFFNLGAGIMNLAVYFASDNPKWFSVVIAAVSFFCAGFLFGEEE